MRRVSLGNPSQIFPLRFLAAAVRGGPWKDNRVKASAQQHQVLNPSNQL
jgi:hypothetical protein